MRIIDISQEVFSCKLYPGDSGPQMLAQKRMAEGELYNLSAFSMGAHNGTHVDAPFHFFADGECIEEIPLAKTVGYCYVCECECAIGREKAMEIAQKAASAHAEAGKRLLIRGNGVLSAEGAQVFADAGIWLVGVEGQSVGPENAPMAVHKILLSRKMVLLEGLRLGAAKEGVYFLCAAPLLLAGSDGAPCRAVLIEM